MANLVWVALAASGVAALAKAFPDAFPIPTRPERENLRPGDMVKLVFVLDPPPTSGPNAERMWVEVRASQPDGVIEGWLTNKPVVITSLGPGAIVAFEPRHVAGRSGIDLECRLARASVAASCAQGHDLIAASAEQGGDSIIIANAAVIVSLDDGASG